MAFRQAGPGSKPKRESRKADEPDEEAERRARDPVPTGVVYLMKSRSLLQDRQEQLGW